MKRCHNSWILSLSIVVILAVSAFADIENGEKDLVPPGGYGMCSSDADCPVVSCKHAVCDTSIGICQYYDQAVDWGFTECTESSQCPTEYICSTDQYTGGTCQIDWNTRQSYAYYRSCLSHTDCMDLSIWPMSSHCVITGTNPADYGYCEVEYLPMAIDPLWRTEPVIGTCIACSDDYECAGSVYPFESQYIQQVPYCNMERGGVCAISIQQGQTYPWASACSSASDCNYFYPEDGITNYCVEFSCQQTYLSYTQPSSSGMCIYYSQCNTEDGSICGFATNPYVIQCTDCASGYGCFAGPGVSVCKECCIDNQCNIDAGEHCAMFSKKCLSEGQCLVDADCPGGGESFCDQLDGMCHEYPAAFWYDCVISTYHGADEWTYAFLDGCTPCPADMYNQGTRYEPDCVVCSPDATSCDSSWHCKKQECDYSMGDNCAVADQPYEGCCFVDDDCPVVSCMHARCDKQMGVCQYYSKAAEDAMVICSVDADCNVDIGEVCSREPNTFGTCQLDSGMYGYYYPRLCSSHADCSDLSVYPLISVCETWGYNPLDRGICGVYFEPLAVDPSWRTETVPSTCMPCITSADCPGYPFLSSDIVQEPVCESGTCLSTIVPQTYPPTYSLCTEHAQCEYLPAGTNCVAQYCTEASVYWSYPTVPAPGFCYYFSTSLCESETAYCDSNNVCQETCDSPNHILPVSDGVYVCAECGVSSDCISDGCHTYECDPVLHTCIASTPAGECCDDTECVNSDPCFPTTCDLESHQCVQSPIPGCCTLDSQCDTANGYVCNTTSNTCVSAIIHCTTSEECPVSDDLICHPIQCTDGTCVRYNLCCETSEDCVPRDDRYTGTCLAGRCRYQLNPGRCDASSGCPQDGLDVCSVNMCTETGYCTVITTPPPVCCHPYTEDCEDYDSCTRDICNAVTHACKNIPLCCETTDQCNDDDICTSDTCFNYPFGKYCEYATIPDCCISDGDCVDDLGSCTLDTCDMETNRCVHTRIEENCCNGTNKYTKCDDGLPATWEMCDMCVGECIRGQYSDFCVRDQMCRCGDSMTGTCNRLTHTCACSQTSTCSVDAECNDYNACTYDVCDSGVCLNLPISGCCNRNDQCNDGDICTLDICPGLGSSCQHKHLDCCCTHDYQCYGGPGEASIEIGGGGGTPRDTGVCILHSCDIGVTDTCLEIFEIGCCESDSHCIPIDACHPTHCDMNEYECVETQLFPPECCLVDSECIAPDECTIATCVQNTCVFEAIPNCCIGNDVCNDLNVCTVDTCDLTLHLCNNIEIPGCCNADEQCYVPESPCTNDYCGADNTCKHDPISPCCMTDIECDDSLPCTTDVCLQNNLCENTLFAKCCGSVEECDDLDICTTDSCIDGICMNDLWSPCCRTDSDCVADTDFCTQDLCDVTTGNCIHPQKEECCNVNADCPNGDPTQCYNYVCDYQTHACVIDPIPNCCTSNNQCADTDACTIDTCVNNVCVNTADPTCCYDDISCDDENECTVDKCNSGVCNHTPFSDNVACTDDGFECTFDACLSGICSHVPKEAGTPCTPDDLECTYDMCNGVESVCTHPQKQDNTLCEIDSSVCTRDVCIGGICTHPALEIGTPCDDDSDVCTADICNEYGICTHSQISGCCKMDGDCQDPSPYCETASCDMETHQCKVITTPAPACCEQNTDCPGYLPCLLNDICVNHVCMPPVYGASCCSNNETCIDGDACTMDVCVLETLQCAHLKYPWACKCHKHSDCLKNYDVPSKCLCAYCDQGMCRQLHTCNDGNGKTADVCNLDGTCTHTLKGQTTVEVPRDDYLATIQYVTEIVDAWMVESGVWYNHWPPNITRITCPAWVATVMQGGPITSTPLSCPLFHQYVDAIGEIVRRSVHCTESETDDVAAPKDDINKKGHHDNLFETFGCPFTPHPCDDQDQCTFDTCDHSLLPNDCCIHIPKDCNDGDMCTTDYCMNGDCIHEQHHCPTPPDSTCVQYECFPGDGACYPVSDTCDSQMGEFGVDSCYSRMCIDGEYVITENDCDDSDPCTVDECVHPIGTCIHSPIQCNDGNGATYDYCVEGSCVKESSINCPSRDACHWNRTVQSGCVGGVVSCHDGNACTSTFCDADGNGCTYEEKVCVQPADLCYVAMCNPSDGKCVTLKKTCDDHNLCTVDTCDADGMCHNEQKTCNDGQICTDDYCNPVTGECVYTATFCNDRNACTEDACIEGVGCISTELPGLGRESADSCKYLVCNNVTGDLIMITELCDDGNACTVDECIHSRCLHRYPKYSDNIEQQCTYAIRNGGNDISGCKDDTCMTYVCLNNETGAHIWTPKELGTRCVVFRDSNNGHPREEEEDHRHHNLLKGKCDGNGTCVPYERNGHFGGVHGGDVSTTTIIIAIIFAAILVILVVIGGVVICLRYSYGNNK